MDIKDKKSLIIKIAIVVVAAAIVICGIFFACSKSGKNDNEGLDSGDAEYGFEYEVVTDENGEPVTDENGNEVTTEVNVKYEKDKNGKTVAYKIDNNGEYVTDKNGERVTVPYNDNSNGGNNSGDKVKPGDVDPEGNFDPSPTEQQDPVEDPTNKDAVDGTTAFDGYETVPKTTASGTPVNFSNDDINTIKNMLEVPYLYLASYENSDGVPIGIAADTAVWMLSRSTGARDSSDPVTYSANEVVLDLFKYYGQTVVNFKSQCNNYAEDSGAHISYSIDNDTFTVTGYTSKKQTVTITSVEDMGDNNFYKVTGTVSGCDKSSVVAIVQRNRLDPTLGYSVKALRWS